MASKFFTKTLQSFATTFKSTTTSSQNPQNDHPSLKKGYSQATQDSQPTLKKENSEEFTIDEKKHFHKSFDTDLSIKRKNFEENQSQTELNILKASLIEKENEIQKVKLHNQDLNKELEVHKGKMNVFTGFLNKIFNRSSKKKQNTDFEKFLTDYQHTIENSKGLCHQSEVQKKMLEQLTKEILEFDEKTKESEEMINFQKKKLKENEEELKKLKENNNKFEKQLEDINKEKEDLKMENVCLKEQLNDALKNDNRKIDDLTIMKEYLVSRTREIEENLKEFKTKSKRFETKFEAKKEKCRNLISDLDIARETEERLRDRIQKKKEKIMKLKDSLEKSQSNEKKLDFSLNSITSEFSSLELKYNNLLYSMGIKKSQIKEEKPAFPYDIIINIDSLKTHYKGWEVLLHHDITLDDFLGSSFSKVGIVGRENIGKTYILNKLCDFQLPTGTNIHTKGLSIKLAKNQDFICFDSAGLQTPVYYYDKKNMERFGTNKEEMLGNPEIMREMINDRTVTDIFIQDFILEICEIIVIVVGQLSQNDQKFIERIKGKYKTKKRIVIIHNFHNLYTNKDVEKRVKKDIIKAFDTIERYIPETEVLEYVEKNQDKTKENISHLILGVDWAESGQSFNKGTLNYLKKILETCVEKKKFDLMQELTEFFEENYRLYLQFRKKPEEKVSLKFNPNENRLYIKTDSDYEISNPVFNSLGALIVNPQYEIIEKNDKSIVLIEIADLDENSLVLSFDKKKSEFICLIIKGIKKYSEFTEENDNKRIVSMRKCGEFTGVFPLGPNYSNMSVKRHDYVKGLLTVEIINNTNEIIEL